MNALSRLRSPIRTHVSLLLVFFMLVGLPTSSGAKWDSDFWGNIFLTVYSTAVPLLAGSGVGLPAAVVVGGIEIATIILCEAFGCEDQGIAPPDDLRDPRRGKNFDELFLAPEIRLPLPAQSDDSVSSAAVEEGIEIIEDLIEDARSLTVTVERYHRAREKPGKKCGYGAAKIPCSEMQLRHGQWLIDRIDSNLRALSVPVEALSNTAAVRSVTVTRADTAEFIESFRAEGPPPFEENLLRAIDASSQERQLLARGHAIELAEAEWEISLAEFLAETSLRLREGRLIRFGSALPEEFLSRRNTGPSLDWDIGALRTATKVRRQVEAKNISCPGKQTFEIRPLATPWLTVESGRRLAKIAVGESKRAELEIDLGRLGPGAHFGLLTVDCITCPPPPKCTQSARRLLLRVVNEADGEKQERPTPAAAELDAHQGWPRPVPQIRQVPAEQYRQAVIDFKAAFAAAEVARSRLESLVPIDTPPDPIDCYFHPWHPGCEVIWDPLADMVLWRTAITENLAPECSESPGHYAINPWAAGAIGWLVGKALDYTWDVGVCLYKADGPDGRGLEGSDGLKKFGNCFVEAASGG